MNYQYSLCLTRYQLQVMSSIPESVVMADEILRLRATVAELVAEKEELRQRIANKEKAERELEEAEADRKFRAKQQEFGDL